jgi:hypothetical protein
MSTQPELQPFDAPVLLVEARYRERTLCAQVLSSHGQRGFTVGRGRRADAPIDPRYLPAGLPANDNYTLVAPSAGGFVINLAPAMREHAERSAARIRIPCGEVVFDITAAEPPQPVPRSWLRRGWRDDARINGGVALGMLLLLLLVFAVPLDPHALSLDDVGKELHMGPAIVIPAAVVEPPLPKDARPAAAGGGAPAVASGPKGTTGDKSARLAEARRATKGPATRQDARDPLAYINSNTLLSILNGQHSASVAAVFDRTSALGDNTRDVLGRLVGTTIGAAWGSGGLASIGTGPGGADTGKAMLGGSGGLGTIGLRRGPGGPGFDDHGGGRPLGRREARVPDVRASFATVRGNLDKDIVRRVVRQHLNEVRYCYEEALARKPTLAGRVVTQFTIGPTGKVIVSVLQSSTLGVPAVESCIVAATKRWLYPAPAGGGLVSVSYPFQLAPAGG